MRISRANSAESGFTLVELLVAIALLALLSLLMADGLRFGARVWERGSSTNRVSGDASIAYSFFKHRLGSAILLPPQQRSAGAHGSFLGEGETYSFVTVDPVNPTMTFRHRLTIDCSNIVQSTSCTADIQMLDLQPIPWVTEHQSSTVLLDGIRHVSFRYFGAPTSQEEPRWLHKWVVMDRLPQLVEMQFKDRSGGHFNWVFELPIRP